MPKKKTDIKKQLERAIKRGRSKRYLLQLYVAGFSPRSQEAIKNIKSLCNEYLQDNYKLTVQDIYQNPIIAKNGQILAAPTLVKKLPLPVRKFVGDMSDTSKLLVGLNLRTQAAR